MQYKLLTHRLNCEKTTQEIQQTQCIQITKQWKIKLTCKLGITVSLQSLNGNESPILHESCQSRANFLKPRFKPAGTGGKGPVFSTNAITLSSGLNKICFLYDVCVLSVSPSLLDNPASSARNLEKVRNSQLKSAAIINFPAS